MQKKEGRIVLMEKRVCTLYGTDKIAVTTVGSKKNLFPFCVGFSFLASLSVFLSARTLCAATLTTTEHVRTQYKDPLTTATTLRLLVV